MGWTFVVLEDFQNFEFTQITPEYGQVGEVFLKNFPAWMKKNAKLVAWHSPYSTIRPMELRAKRKFRRRAKVSNSTREGGWCY